MRIELNLASRPTENRRRFLVLAITGVAILSAVLILQTAIYLHHWAGGRDMVRRTDQTLAEIKKLSDEQKQIEAKLQQPEALEIFDASSFLNGLILQRSFSWTKLFMDLEKIMPNDVQVATIRPRVLGTNSAKSESEVSLDLGVLGKSTNALIQFVQNLEGSDKFSDVVLKLETPPGMGGSDNAAQLSLTVTYVQK